MTILENYLKSKKVQKTLSTKPGEEGFSLIELVVVIAVLAILSAVAIPAFNGVQANARALKNENYQNLKTQCYYTLAKKINEGQIFGMLGPNGVGKSTIAVNLAFALQKLMRKKIIGNRKSFFI